MTTITNTITIETALEKFQPAARGAFATCCCLPGEYAQDNQQEWVEHGTIDGVPVCIYYVFENTECECEDARDYPWDADHVSKIEVVEKDGGRE